MLARFFIDRPVFAWVLSLVIILIGVVAVFFLPIDQYPNITPPTIAVTTTYPGANAQTVADTVGSPIEEQVNGVQNMMYMSSQSTNDGAYTLTVSFEIGTDPNMAQVLVQNRVSLAMAQLPQQVQLQGVSTLLRSPSLLLAVSLVSPTNQYDDLYLSNYATIFLRDQLLRVPGVGDITIFGERDYAMRIWIDPDKMAARGLTASDLVSAIQAQNVQVTAGTVGRQPAPPGQQLELTVSTLGRLQTVQQFGNIIVKTGPPSTATATVPSTSAASAPAATSTANSTTSPTASPTAASAAPGTIAPAVVRVRDVASIEMGAQNYDISSRLDGRPSAGLGIFQLPGSNALTVAKAIRTRMESLRQGFPPGLDYEIVYDTTPFVQQSVDEVVKALFLAVLLVALVVLFFLQDWKAMILPMIDVPVSLVGTFAVMAALGFTLNNLTLFGLVLAIGIVVDDAIVVLENIERLLATGLDVRTATIQAMDEITGPIIAITLVLASVFVPSIFIPGLTGQFYKQFAVTIAASMIISALNALTLTPSRAVAIFKTEATGHGHEYKHEVLPWWFFAIVGGVVTYWFAPTFLPGPLSIYGGPGAPNWRYWMAKVITFLPGFLVGGVVGWFIINPVNSFLGWFFGGFNRLFEWVTRGYGWVIRKLLRLSAVVLVVYLGLLGATWWGVTSTPTGFIPTQDQGYLLASVQLPDAASVQRTQAIMAQLDKIARSVPGVAHTVGISGESFVLATNAPNFGSMFVVLKPFEQRQTADTYDAAIADKIQAICARQVPGALVTVFRAPPIRGLSNAGGFQAEVEQRGIVNLPQLQAATEGLVGRLTKTGQFINVFTQFRAATPQVFIDFDRTKAQALGVSITDLFATQQVYMGGFYVNQFNLFGRTWEVQVQAAPKFRTSADMVRRYQVRNNLGQLVPLASVAKITSAVGPLVVNRYNMYIAAPINGTAVPGVSSGDVINAVTRAAQEAHVPFEWTGTSYLEVQAGNVAFAVFAIATLMVYLILAARYESWRLPLAVILVVPCCMLAAVAGMAVFDFPLDIFVQVGLLVLVGLASKNAILVVEFARDLHEDGEGLHEAAVSASRIRFRPIIMTSLAFTLGVLPLVLASGAGKEMRQSLGLAVFSGMIGVTAFGVFLTPVFFFSLLWLTERKRPTEAAGTPHGFIGTAGPGQRGTNGVWIVSPGREESRGQGVP